MRIGPFHIGRVQAATQPARAQRELGASGTINVDGILQQDEYNPTLQGQSALRTYDRMRRSDSSVREALQHIFAPIKNATWEIEPASDDPEDLEIAAFIDASYFKWPTQPFHEYLNQALHYLTFGYQVFEQVDQIIDAELEFSVPGEDAPRTIPSRQFLTLKRFAQRLPHTIYRWNMEDGELTSIVQFLFTGAEPPQVEIPADRLLVYTNEREGDDLTGISLLRTAYKPWVMKELVEKCAAVGVERHGVGINTMYVPDRYRDDDAMMDRIEDMLANLRSGEFNYLVIPGPKGTGGSDQSMNGFYFEIVGPAGGIPDFTQLLAYHRGEIKGNVLARFGELGHGQTGARATGDTQSEVWYDGLHAVARHVSAVNDIAIRRLVDANYPNVTRYPTLEARDIESKSLSEFADANSKLVLAGAIIPDQPFRDFVRQSVDAPEESEEVEQDLQEQKQLDREMQKHIEPDNPAPNDQPPVKPPAQE